MKTFLFAAAAFAAVATSVGNAGAVAVPVRVTRLRPALAYRYSGPHAGGPANDLIR
jgi:hypothetical protein